jgi:hypothetical protein
MENSLLYEENVGNTITMSNMLIKFNIEPTTHISQIGNREKCKHEKQNIEFPILLIF